MRLAKPNNLNDLDLSSVKKPDDHLVEYDVKVITPIYGGGVKAGEPDHNMPIRAAAIKGQLRYWWRFLQSNHIDDKDKKLIGEELFIKEREIWGGMADAKELEEALKKGKDFSSKVFIQIDIGEAAIKESSTGKYAKDNETNRSALHYSLFPAIQNSQNSQNLLDCEDLVFTLKIRAKKSELTKFQWQNVQETIQWWASFGGIGARTRRGLGSVEIEQIEAITKEQASQYGCTFNSLPANPDAITAWNKSIEKLQSFRQGKGIGRNIGADPKIPKKLGRSFWPEADSIRQITKKDANGKHPIKHKSVGSFPRAAFGLPIIFEFHGASGEPSKTELKPNNSERMASPLILKPMAVGDNKYAPIALLLPVKHLMTLDLTLMESKRELKKIPSNKWWPHNKDKQATLAEYTQPMKNNHGNTALEAFMNYFGGN